MSWANPTKKQAEDGYGNAKAKYQSAAENYVQTSRQIQGCYADYKNCSAKADSMRSEKLNFEKRVADIESIIRMLESGGVVDDTVKTANDAAKRSEEVFSKNFTCSDVPLPSISETFKFQTVEQNQHSSAALRELKNEKARLEQALQEVDSKLKAMDQNVEELTKKMSDLTAMQSKLSSTMKSCSFEMNHYKRFV